MGKDSQAPIYIAILVAVILIAAGGYFVMGGGTNQKSSTEKNTNTKSDSSMSYVFIDRGHGGVTIELTGTPSRTISRIDTLGTGLSKLRSICNVVSYETLSYDDGETNAYSVTVEGTCNTNK